MNGVVIRPSRLTPQQLIQLVQLHRVSLPNSALSSLSDSFVGAYYKFVLVSSFEELFLVSSDSIVGAAVLSLKPSSLMNRFMLAYICSGKWIWRPDDLARAVLHGVREMLQAKGNVAEMKGLGEVVQIYVAAAHRQKKLGVALLQAVEAHLRQMHAKSYFLKTENQASNRAVKFYERNGFERLSESDSSSVPYAYFVKRL